MIIKEKDYVEECKIILRDLECTNSSMSKASDFFFTISVKGNTSILVELWEKYFNDANSEKKIYFLYLLFQIVQNFYKDEGKLKNQFEPLLNEAFYNAYIDQVDNSKKEDILTLLGKMKILKIYNERLISIIQERLISQNKKEIEPDQFSSLASKFSKLKIPLELPEISNNFENFKDWQEKVDRSLSTINDAIQNGIIDKTTKNDLILKCAEAERSIRMCNDYKIKLKEKLSDYITGQINSYVQDLISYNQVCTFIEEINIAK